MDVFRGVPGFRSRAGSKRARGTGNSPSSGRDRDSTLTPRTSKKGGRGGPLAPVQMDPTNESKSRKRKSEQIEMASKGLTTQPQKI